MRNQLAIVVIALVGCASSKPAPRGPERDPTDPVSAPAVEQMVAETISLAASQDARSVEHLADVLLVGAGMWDVLTGMERACCDDDRLYVVGTQAFIVLPADPGRGWRARAYSGDDRTSLVKLKPFKTIMTAFAKATVRPATVEERRFFGAVHHVDIAGAPLTVLERQRDARLIVYVADGKITIVDALAGYDLADRVDVAAELARAK
jgi:hypothetical protein